jgi:hypothetical protein
MRVIVDYRCDGCALRTEILVSRPIPGSASCPACGGPARRLFGIGGLRTGAGPVRPGLRPAAADYAAAQFAAVPGACHLPPTAARRLVARAVGDKRAEDREIARQERAVREGRLDPSHAVTGCAGSANSPTQSRSREERS